MHGYQLSRELGRVARRLLARLLRLALPVAAAPRARRRASRACPSDEARGAAQERLPRSPRRARSSSSSCCRRPRTTTQTEDTRFRVRLAFFRYLPPETRIRLLERRRASLEDRLATIKDSLRATRERVDDYTLALHGARARRHRVRHRVARRADPGSERQKHETPPPWGSERRASATLRRKERTA